MKKQLLTLAAFFAITASASAQTFSNGATAYSISYVTGASNQTCFANFGGSSGGAAWGGGNVVSYSYANDAGTPVPTYSAMTWTGDATAPDFNLAAPFWMNLSQVNGTCVSMSQVAVPGGYNSINMSANAGFSIRAKSSVAGTKVRIFLGYSLNGAAPATDTYHDNVLETITLTTSFEDYAIDFSAWANRGKVNMYGLIIEDGGSPVISVEGVAFGSVVTANQNANVVNDQVSLFPNPAKGSFSVDMNAMNNSEAATLKVMNANGVVVKEVSSTNPVENITTEGMNKGIYMVQVTSGNKIATKKIVVE